MTRLLLPLTLLLALAAGGAASAQTTTVRDSLRITSTFETEIYPSSTGGTCVNRAYGVHDDPIGRGRGVGGYTYVTGFIPPLYTSDTSPLPGAPQDIPGVQVAVITGLNTSSTSNTSINSCGNILARLQAITLGRDLYAIYTTTEGPVASFTWEQTDGLTVRFDGTGSHVATKQGRRPVSSYEWNYGDSRTASTTQHTFQQAGRYEVKLTVTDDKGNEDTYRETITVSDYQLTVRALPVEPGARYTKGDTLVVETTVVNTGSRAVLDVVVPPTTDALSALAVAGPGGSAPTVADMAPLRRRDAETRAVFNPGERIAVRDSFRVVKVGSYRVGSETRFAETKAWAELSGTVQATSPGDEPVVIRRPCQNGACETWIVAPPVRTLDFTLRTVTGDNPASVPAGVTYNEANGWAGFLNTDTGYNLDADGNLIVAADDITCQSGCVEMIATVTDENGAPVEGAEVRFTTTQLSGPAVATVAPRGNFFCTKGRAINPPPQRCLSNNLTHKTDADGQARAIYSVQSVLEPVESTVRTVILYDGGVLDDDEETVTVTPNVVFESEYTMTRYDSRFLLANRQLVRLGGNGNSIAEFCEDAVKQGKQLLPDASSVQRNAEYFAINVGSAWVCDGFLGAARDVAIRGKKVLDWLVGEGSVGGTAASVGDALKKLGSTNLYLGGLKAYRVKNPYALSLASGPNPPPAVVFFDGDFFDFTVEALAKLVGEVTYDASGVPQARDLDGVRTRLRITDLSTRRSGASPGVISTNYLQGRAVLEEFQGGAWTVVHSADISYLYLPHLFVGPGRTEWLAEKLGLTGQDASAGDLSLTAGPPPARPAGDASASAAADYAVGDILLIGRDAATAELNQVATVTGTTLGLVLPLASAHPAGARVSLFAAGTAGPPPPPLLVANTNSAADVELGWTPHPATLAASFDIQIATDEALTALVLDSTGTTVTSAPISPDAFTEGETYYWRVRARNRLGVGEWTGVFPFTAGERVVTPTDEAPEALPDVLALAAYPNPARQRATLAVEVPEAGMLRVSLYDALGREVAVLADGERPAGRHEIVVQVSSLPAGLYVVRAQAGSETITRTITVVR